MRISVNLASRPFVELRPFFLRLRIIMAALLVVGVGVAIATHSMDKKLSVAEARMDNLRNRTIAFQMEKHANEARMRQPANAAVLDRSHFLNDLFLRKSFSWTAVMMDLENVLPIGVQVTSIEPSVTAQGDVVIRLRVSGERDLAVQLVRNLERSRRFLQPRLAAETAQAKDTNGAVLAPGVTPGVEFEILANYNPLPEDEPFKETKAAATAGAAGSSGAGGTTSAPRHRAFKPGPGDGIVLKPYVAPRPAGASQPAGLARPTQPARTGPPLNLPRGAAAPSQGGPR